MKHFTKYKNQTQMNKIVTKGVITLSLNRMDLIKFLRKAKNTDDDDTNTLTHKYTHLPLMVITNSD